jgi:hypothetical protein
MSVVRSPPASTSDAWRDLGKLRDHRLRDRFGDENRRIEDRIRSV